MATQPENEILEQKLLWVQRVAGVRMTGVLHIGAHLGQEAPVYNRLGLKPVVWVEGNADICQRLEREVANFPSHQVYNCVASDTDGLPMQFHITNNDGQSSSVLPPDRKRMQRAFPDLHAVRTVNVVTSRLDTFFTEREVDTSLCNLLNIDVQGYELATVRGLGKRIASVDFICSEVNLAKVYKGAALFHELDWFITGRDFKRVWLTATGPQGEALYVRSKTNLATRLISVVACVLVETGYKCGLNEMLRRNTFIFSLIKRAYFTLKGRGTSVS